MGDRLRAVACNEQPFCMLYAALLHKLPDRATAAHSETARELANRKVTESRKLRKRRRLSELSYALIDQTQSPCSQSPFCSAVWVYRAISAQFDGEL